MHRAFGTTAPDAAARWTSMFAENPASSELFYMVADTGTQLAGQYPLVPHRLQHDGKPMLGLLVADIATDPAFERQSICTTLARRLYAEASAEAPIVFGRPNERSSPLFYNRLDWVALRPFPLLLCPLRNLTHAMRARHAALAPFGQVADALVRAALEIPSFTSLQMQRARGAEVQPFDDFGPWVDELWSELAPHLGTAVIRDATFLRWRYAPCRGHYRRVALLRGGKPVGLAVSTRHGEHVYLHELMVPKDDASGARALLGWTVLEAAREGAAGVITLATRKHPHYGVHLTSGFLPVPARHKAHPFGVRQNGHGVVPDRLFHLDDWYFSGSDLDVP